MLTVSFVFVVPKGWFSVNIGQTVVYVFAQAPIAEVAAEVLVEPVLSQFADLLP